MWTGFSVWLPPRSLAVRCCRIHLGWCGAAPLVVGSNLQIGVVTCPTKFLLRAVCLTKNCGIAKQHSLRSLSPLWSPLTATLSRSPAIANRLRLCDARSLQAVVADLSYCRDV